MFGTFDILHPGHEFLLREAGRLGDNLVVLVARDKTVHEVKRHQPKNNEKTRVKNIEKLMLADKVILGREGEDKYAVIHEEEPDIIALGYDQKFFIENLKKVFPDVTIVRIKSFKPDIYHSSLLDTTSGN